MTKCSQIVALVFSCICVCVCVALGKRKQVVEYLLSKERKLIDDEFSLTLLLIPFTIVCWRQKHACSYLLLVCLQS